MKLSHKLLSLSILLASTAACSHVGEGDDVYDNPNKDEAGVFETSDLSLFELRHKVKRVTRTTYLNVRQEKDSLVVDTTAANRLETTIYFDSLGQYVPRRDERLRRDKEGRIIRWEDRKPNLRRLHGGFLKDTLTYEHLSDNVVCSGGMGDYAITVYDDKHNIVGQYTDPLVDGEHTACFNVYRDFDDHGNWTERMSVWTTQSTGQRPHVSHTLERREITYYK